jgi:hypothetical protein
VVGDESAADEREIEVAVVESVEADRERADERDQGLERGVRRPPLLASRAVTDRVFVAGRAAHRATEA